MLAEMPARLFDEWQAYYRIEPFGQKKSDSQVALLNATLANIYRKKHTSAFTLDDYLLKIEQHKEKSWQELLEVVEQMNKAMGGIDKRSEQQKQWRKL